MTSSSLSIYQDPGRNPISQTQKKPGGCPVSALRRQARAPRGRLCRAAGPVCCPSSTAHGEQLSAAFPHPACHHSPVPGVPRAIQKGWPQGCLPTTASGPWFSSRSSPTFFTLRPRQGSDPPMSPYRGHVGLEDSEKAGPSSSRPTCCRTATVRERFCPVTGLL